MLPVYAGDRAPFLAQALESVTTAQTRTPDQVVIIVDGPVGADIEAVLAARDDIDVVRLSDNRGLTDALNEGLRHCRYDIVARQDADDISAPDRFAVQIPLAASGIDLVGSDIVEFDAAGEGPVRSLPVAEADIVRALPLRDPFAHPAVVYSRAAVAAVGGYDGPAGMEDYWLFARMVAAGCSCVNVPRPLVSYRVDAGAYARRGGWDLFVTECRLQVRLYNLGVTGGLTMARNIVVRGLYRFVPPSLRRCLYRGVGLNYLFRRAS
nr:glycosyltransferase [Nanchangia anserum]